MAKAKEEDELAMLEKGIEELCTQIETTYCRQSLEKTSGPRNKCYKYITSLKDNWSKKLAEGDEIIRKVHQYTNECCQKNKLAEEKQQKLSEILAIIEDEKKQEKELKENIQALKEELIRKNKISAENKATEEVTEKLRNAENLFKEGLGLEIRRTSGLKKLLSAYTRVRDLAGFYSENQLQFIFRCISRKDFDEPYTLTLSLNEEGTYEVISCFPPLDCIKELQAKVRETNNFSAFIANVRKAFVTLTYK